jgi:hypothetical protein
MNRFITLAPFDVVSDSTVDSRRPTRSAVNRNGSQSRRSRKPVILSKESPRIAVGAMDRRKYSADVEKRTTGS